MRIFPLLLWCLLGISLAQTRADSLFAEAMAMPNDSFKVKRINEIAFYLVRSQASSAFDFAEKALTLAEEIHYPAGMAKATYILAVVQLQLGQREEALASYIAVLQLCNQHGLKAQKGDALRGMGIFFRETGDKESSEKYTWQSIAIARELGDSLGVAKGLSNLSILSMDEEHLRYVLQATDIMEELLSSGKGGAREADFLGLMYNNISNQYLAINKMNEAIEYSKKAIEINMKNNNLYNGLLAYIQVASIHNTIGQYPQALQAALKALDIAQQAGNSDIAVADLHSVLSSIYLNLANYPYALRYCEKACSMFRDLENTTNLVQEMCSMTLILQKLKRENEALVKINEAYTLATTHEIPLLAGHCELLAGQLLVAQHKDAEALIRLQHCLRLHEQKDLSEADLQAACKELTALYDRLQQPEKAAEMQKRYESLLVP